MTDVQIDRLLTRTQDTEDGYLVRAWQLYRAIKADHTKDKFTVTDFIDGLLTKRESYRPSSWRYNRRAVTFALSLKIRQAPQTADVFESAIARLLSAPPVKHDQKLPPRTSSNKQKRFFEEDAEAVMHLALSHPTAIALALVDLLQGGLLTGLRPCEWPHATLTMTDLPQARWILRVRNAKGTNGRGLGEERELRWADLPRALLEHVSACIELAQRVDYERMLAAVGDLLADLTRQLWPRRSAFPTLYSTRHEAIARWKNRFLHPDQPAPARLRGLATIAALAGHATDETATRHYGRPRRGRDRISRFPIPTPDPAKIADVRHTLNPEWTRLRMNDPGQDPDH